MQVKESKKTQRGYQGYRSWKGAQDFIQFAQDSDDEAGAAPAHRGLVVVTSKASERKAKADKVAYSRRVAIEAARESRDHPSLSISRKNPRVRMRSAGLKSQVYKKHPSGGKSKSMSRPGSAVGSVFSDDEDVMNGAGISNRRWIPMGVRMQMLKRDMELAQLNQSIVTKTEATIAAETEREELYVSPTVVARREKLMERNSVKRCCALCEQGYSKANLPLQV